MSLIMPCHGAHLELGEEVMVMDDVDVHVSTTSVSGTFNREERMSEHG
jgi:hypothetical protein